LLRPLVLFIFGITLGEKLFDISGLAPLVSFLREHPYSLPIACAVPLIGCLCLSGRRYGRELFYIPLFLFNFMLGAAMTILTIFSLEPDLPQGDFTCHARLLDDPAVKRNSLLFHATITDLVDSGRVYHKSHQQSYLLYLRNDSSARQLRMNDEIVIRPTLFDQDTKSLLSRYNYRDYLYRNGISGTCYADSAHYALLRHTDQLSLSQRATICKERIINLYKRLGFRDDNLAVLSALTLGYRDTLDRELQEAYSVAGVSHVLAISGMHIGFICALLMLLMNIVRTHKKGILLAKYLIVIAILWCYVFLIGFPTSAVRAATMFSLYLLLTKLSTGQRSPINTLLISAFLMLLVRPLWLFDVGFQLSFAAVTGIFLLYEPLLRQWKTKNRVLRYIWATICLTLVAQLATAPLSLYYFFRLPTYFLLTNPLIILLITLIVYSVVFMLLLFPIPPLQQLISYIVDHMLTLLNTTISHIGELPHSSIEGIYINLLQLVLIYASIISFVAFLMHLSGRRLIRATIFTFLFLVSEIWFIQTNTPADRITLLNCYGTPVVHCSSHHGNSWAVIPDSSSALRPSLFSYYSSKHRLTNPQVVNGRYKAGRLSVREQIVSYKGCRVVMLTDARWQRTHLEEPFSVDCIYVCRGFRGDFGHIMQLFSPHRVVIDSSLTERRSRQIAEKCSELGVECKTLSREGSASIML
jgi:competence protein ComEC